MKTLTVRDSIYKLIDESKSKRILRLPPERDLAISLGASRATLSRILSDIEREGLIERRHGSGTYIVDRSQPCGTCFGVLLRGVIHKSRPHFDAIMHGLSEHAASLGVHLQIFEDVRSQFEADPEHNRLGRIIDAGLIDGLLVISRMPVDIVARLHHRLPLVTVNNVISPTEIASVICDYFRAGFLAASHLAAQGHRQIVYVTDRMEHPESVENLSGFRCALEAHGLTFGEANLLVTGANSDTVAARLEEHLSRHASTAFFVRFDFLAAQVIRMLQRLGRQVPRDLSVIGMGNYAVGYNSPVPLTTIDNRLSDVGRKALEILMESRKGAPLDVGVHLLDPKLIERESVCPPGR